MVAPYRLVVEMSALSIPNPMPNWQKFLFGEAISVA